MRNIYTRVNKLLDNKKLMLILILLAGFLVRLYKINNPIADWHSFRQADTASVSREYVKNGINLLIPRYHDLSRVQSGKLNLEGYRFVEFPIYNAVHAWFSGNFQFLPLEVWGRLLSIIFSLISAVLLFKIGKIKYGSDFGLLTAFIFLFLPFNIYFTRVILPEPLAIMLGLLSLYLFLIYENNKKLSLFLSSAFFLALAVLVKPYAIFLAFYQVYSYFSKLGLKKTLLKKEIYIYFALTFIPFILWRNWMGQFPEGIPFWKWTLNGDGIRFKPAFWYWIMGERLGSLILGVWGTVLFVFGLIDLKKKDSLLVGSILGSFFYVSIFATANVRHDYYQAFIIPSVSLMSAYGLIQLKDYFKNKRFGVAFPIFILLLSLLISAFKAKEFYKINHPEIMEAGKAADRLLPEDAIIIAPYVGDTAFLYQTKRKGWPVVERPINELVDEGAQYYVAVTPYSDQTLSFIDEFKVIAQESSYIILDLREKKQ